MHLVHLTIPALLALAFGLATWLEPWFQSWAGSRTGSANVLTVALGDSRRLFASHVFVKADAYFHQGAYSGVFDPKPAEKCDSLHGNTSAVPNSTEPARADDWLARFTKHFRPNGHRHLGDEHSGESCDGAHDHGTEHDCEGGEEGMEREMLPWLRLAATLDPEQPQTYVVAAYWLKTRLHRVREAEQFLREGLRHNPGNPELLLELGKLFAHETWDWNRARNVWELGARNWREKAGKETQPDGYVYAQLLIHLANLEEHSGDHLRAIQHLRTLSEAQANRAQLQAWLQRLDEMPPGHLDLQHFGDWLAR
jgi:hypothetical protein